MCALPIVGNSIDWAPIIDMRSDYPPSQFAFMANEAVENRDSVLELGAGPCVDAEYFISMGYKKVVGIDSCSQSKLYADVLGRRFPGTFEFRLQRFQDVRSGVAENDLVYSNGSLFCYGKQGFEDFIARLIASLSPKGVFAATFSGDKHQEAARLRDYAYTSKAELDRMLHGLDILLYEEQYERDVDGYVHNHFVIARKP
jgi:hypothetical protein